MNKKIPLIVDLDGTVIKTDILYESILKLLKKNPLYIFKIFRWIISGKVYLKRRISKLVHINPELLPYNYSVITWLKEEKKNRNKIILATGTSQNVAIQIGSYLKVFDEAYGSNKKNLVGEEKKEFLCKKYGAQEFDYMGNSYQDIKVWKASNFKYLVNASKRLQKHVYSQFSAQEKKIHILTEKPSGLCKKAKILAKTVRAHQWIKNVLIYVPIFLSHNYFDVEILLNFVIAFISFSLCSSSVYVINDLIDLENDRAHPTKKNRPFASGELSLISGFILSLTLFSTSIFMSYFLDSVFLMLIVIYFLLSTAYTFKMKEIPVIDLFVLTLFYLIRIVSGGIFIDVSLSEWLIMFSFVLFLSLSILKRYTEINNNQKQFSDKNNLNLGRAYSIKDLPTLLTFGISSGAMSFLIFIIYISSTEASTFYATKHYLLIVGIFILYWLFRLWHLATRKQMDDDPVRFVIKDNQSLIILFSSIFLIFISAM